MTKQINPAFIYKLVTEQRGRPVWSHLHVVLPHVLFEVMALGPAAILHVGTRYVRLLLDDGRVYKLRFDHEVHHALVLHRMHGNSNGKPVAVFTNATTPAEVWAAFHPAAAAKRAA